MSKFFRNLPLRFRIAVSIWIVANALALGLFVVGPPSYKAWFAEYGLVLEGLAAITLFVIGTINTDT